MTNEVLQRYVPEKPHGYPVYYKQESDEDIAMVVQIAKIKQDAMIKAGQYPTGDLTTPEGRVLKADADAIIDEFVEMTFYQAQRNWLVANHREHPVYDILIDENGYLVTIDFATAEGRAAFLEQFPKWVTERPKVWFDGAVISEVREE